MIGLAEIIVDGLRDADNADGTAVAFSVLGQLLHGVHGIIAADIEKRFNVVSFKLLKYEDIG